MQVKVTRLSQVQDRILYDGPAIEHNYPVNEFFRVIAGNRTEGHGIILRFGFINTEREKIQIHCELSKAETIHMYRDLVGWLDSLLKEAGLSFNDFRKP